MPDTLSVDINRKHLHSVEASESFEARDSFDVEIENHGEAVHVHLHLDDALSEVASIEAINHHLRPGAVRRVPVTVRREEQPVVGRLKVTAAYGAETRFVDLSIGAARPDKPPVEVDAALGQPTSGESRSGTGGVRAARRDRRSRSPRGSRSPSSGIRSSAGPRSGLDSRVLGVGVVVVLLALVAIAVIGDPLVLIASLVVLLGVAVAGYVSLR